MPLLLHLNEFRSAIAYCHALVAAAHRVDSSGIAMWSNQQIETITQTAYLGLFIAWESYLEQALVAYMLGEPSCKGTVVTRWVNPQGRDAALAMLVGTQKYVDYSNPDIVCKLAKIMLDPSSPVVTIINSIKGELSDMKTIRNASAHLTTTTIAPLEALATRKLGPPKRSGITVCQFLLTLDPNVPQSANLGHTMLITYSKLLDAAAEAIANA